MNCHDNAIEVRDLSKYFKIYYDRGITFKERILTRGRSRYEKRAVLKGISFSVKQGEAIGLIGKNGCGKSTTLKLLAKIIHPNTGTVELSGRVSSLLELGAGFHPDMSGRENIYMNAAVFGLNKKEIDKRADAIIKFSELEDFIDNPVRTYSSGMYMRLAFSVAINVDADILLIDEILAVGDISFQKKCFEKLMEIKMSGTTIVIVSHSMDQIEKICDRSIWIENGLIKEEGKPREIHEHYLQDMEQKRLEKFQNEIYESIVEDNASISEKQVVEQPQNFVIAENNSCRSDIIGEMAALKKNLLKKTNLKRNGSGTIRFSDLYITDSSGEEKVYFETGQEMNIYLKYVSKQKVLLGTICLLFYRADGIYCYGTNTFIELRELQRFTEEGVAKITIDYMPLLPGKYYITISLHDEMAIEYDTISQAACVQVLSNKGDEGIVRINTLWDVQPEEKKTQLS